MFRRPFLALAIALVTIVHAFPAASVVPWQDKVDSRLLAEVGSAPVDILVILAEQADLSPAATAGDRRAKGRLVCTALQETAERTQSGPRAVLDAAGIPYRRFWIVNAIAVRQADAAVLESLASRIDVARIEPDPLVPLALPEESALAAYAPGSRTIPWNITQIAAPAVWATGNTGQNAVIGVLDTGCDWQHPAVLDQYRGWDGAAADHDYNWHDAAHGSGGDLPAPFDDNGHGTHLLGIAVGDDGQGMQIGVAPGARWIACRCIIGGWSSPSLFFEGFEFMVAPTPVGGGAGDPDRAPDVITTAWFCPPALGCAWGTLLPAVAAVRAAGIVVVAAAGAGGPGCGTIVYPPEVYDESYTAGSTSTGDIIAPFTGRGPVVSEQGTLIKPDCSAPGVDVLSCVLGGGYEYWSGTAAAVAHVAGVMALAVTANPTLGGNPDAIEACLNATALPLMSSQCGDGGAVPNNVYGHGRVDAEAACAHTTAVLPGVTAGVRLLPNVPNPFNPRTNLVYELDRNAAVDLRIYDASGRLVRVLVADLEQAAGRHEVTWDGRDDRGIDVAAGVYLSQLRAGSDMVAGRLVLLR